MDNTSAKINYVWSGRVSQATYPSWSNVRRCNNVSDHWRGASSRSGPKWISARIHGLPSDRLQQTIIDQSLMGAPVRPFVHFISVTIALLPSGSFKAIVRRNCLNLICSTEVVNYFDLVLFDRDPPPRLARHANSACFRFGGLEWSIC